MLDEVTEQLAIGLFGRYEILTGALTVRFKRRLETPRVVLCRAWLEGHYQRFWDFPPILRLMWDSPFRFKLFSCVEQWINHPASSNSVLLFLSDDQVGRIAKAVEKSEPDEGLNILTS